MITMPEKIDRASYFERLGRKIGLMNDKNFGDKERKEAYNELTKFFNKWKLGKVGELEKDFYRVKVPSFLKANNQFVARIVWDQYEAAYTSPDGEQYGADAAVYQMLDDLKKSSKKFNWLYSNWYTSDYSGECMVEVFAETKKHAKRFEEGGTIMPMTTQDMVALRKARALIEDVAPRTAFGRSVNYIEDRWDNGKCLLGVYEASENWDKATTDQYVADACYYLNNLNEHFKVPGYHFDLTGITEGNLYVAKDREETDWAFNSCDGEYDYMQENAYRQYLANKAEVQHKLSLMVHEATIIVDEESDYASKLGQLMSIQEGVTDSISDAWTKFKNFLGKMWAKFTEFLSRTINSDKNYLDKYKDIILNKKFQLDSVELDGDYKVGINRLSTYTINTPNPRDIEGYPAENNAENLKLVQKKFFSEYNGSIEFSDFCKNYFKGSRDGKENRMQLTEANVNMTDLFNYCYNYQKIHSTLNKNYGIMQKAGDSFIAMAKEMDKAGIQHTKDQHVGQGNATQSEIDAGTAKAKGTTPPSAFRPTKNFQGNANGATAANPANDQKLKDAIAEYNKLTNPKDAAEEGKKESLANDINKYAGKEIIKITQITTASAIITCLGYPIEEAASLHEKVTFGSGSGSGGTNTSKSSFSPNASAFGNATGAGNVTQHQGVSNVDKEGNVTHSVSAEDMKDDAKNLVTKVNMYTSTASTVFAGMLQAAQTIQKDYMAVIKRHVQSYLGDKESPDTAAQSATTNNVSDPNMAKPTTEMISDLRGRAHRIETIRSNAGLTPEQKNTQINAELQSASASVNNARAFQSEADINQYADQLQNALDQQNKNNQPAQGQQ